MCVTPIIRNATTNGPKCRRSCRMQKEEIVAMEARRRKAGEERLDLA